jgi:hypothetical protein
MYQALECCARDAFGPGDSWAARLDSGLANNLGGWLAGTCSGIIIMMQHVCAASSLWVHGTQEFRKVNLVTYSNLLLITMKVLLKRIHLLHRAGKYRKYSYTSLRDLLRVIRNKHSHFRWAAVSCADVRGIICCEILRPVLPDLRAC